MAGHALVAHERIHERVLEGVAHVKAAGHVRRRDHNAVGRADTAGGEVAGLFPVGVEIGFQGLGLVGLFHGRGASRRRRNKAANATAKRAGTLRLPVS